MIHPTVEKKLIKETLTKAKTVAMVGISFNKKEETRTSIRRRPSIIVMKYLQEFGYKVIPVILFQKEVKIDFLYRYHKQDNTASKLAVYLLLYLNLQRGLKWHSLKVWKKSSVFS